MQQVHQFFNELTFPYILSLRSRPDADWRQASGNLFAAAVLYKDEAAI